MTLTLSAPSKTFLSGEYAVMAGAPAIVLLTEPRFRMDVTKGSGQVVGIPEGSPARKWLALRRPLLSELKIEFHDPHGGAGGLGASGAQFLLSHCLTTFLQSSFARVLGGPVIADVWNDQQVLSEGIGSGADVLAQAAGGVAVVDAESRSAKSVDWPYPEIHWTIVRTHQKIATHEHLKKLDRARLDVLIEPAKTCAESFGQGGPGKFVENLKQFAAVLRRCELQAPAAQSLVNLLENESWCLAAKGCGALGADTVLFLYPSAERERVGAFVRKTSLQTVATQATLSHGLEMSWL